MKIRHIVVAGVGLLLITAIVSATALAVTNQTQLVSVDSTNMEPTLSQGDLLFGKKPADAGVISFGQVVVYSKNSTSNVKRVVGINKERGKITLASDNVVGDNEVVKATDVISISSGSVPMAGYLLNDIRHREVLIGLVYIPMTLIIFREAKRLSRHYWQKPYNLSS